MKTRTLLVACFILGIGSIAAAIDSENMASNTLKIIINGDTMIVSVDGISGEGKKVILSDCYSFDDKFKFDNNQELPFQINDELIIDGDHIIIDGVKYSSDDIEKLSFSGRTESGFNFRAKLPYKDYEFSRKKVIEASRYDSEDRFSFDRLVIASGEVVHGDAVAVTGDVKVYGEVMGDVISVFGDVIMYEGSFAGGDVVAPLGKVIRKGSAIIKGKHLPKKKFRKHADDTDFEMNVRYNRVEGFTLLGGIHYTDENRELPDIDINAGYAFSLKKWDFDIGIRQEFGDNWAFYYGGSLYQGAVTPDEWIFSQSENTIASLFFKEDFHDFYFRKGVKGFIGQKLDKNAFAQLEYTIQSNESLIKNTNRAIFGGKKNFRENYSTVGDDQTLLESIDGNLHMFGLRLGWDSRDNKTWPESGQFVEALWESAGDGVFADLGGDHSYDIVQAAISHNQSLTKKQHFSVWLRGGYSDQQLPLNRWMFLGGVGSLRGYDYKEFSGNRYILANLDYYFDFSDDFALAVFADAGKTGFDEQEFNDMKFKSDLGAGIVFDENLRIDIAQRLDDTGEGPVIMARFNVHF